MTQTETNMQTYSDSQMLSPSVNWLASQSPSQSDRETDRQKDKQSVKQTHKGSQQGQIYRSVSHFCDVHEINLKLNEKTSK